MRCRPADAAAGRVQAIAVPDLSVGAGWGAQHPAVVRVRGPDRSVGGRAVWLLSWHARGVGQSGGGREKFPGCSVSRFPAPL